MEIVRNTDYLINKYLYDFKNKRLKKPDCCKICGRKCNLTWHAKYTRTVITLFGIHSLPVKRLLCPLCKHTFAFLPKFIEKYHRYAKDVISFALEKLEKFDCSAIISKLDKFLEPAEIYISNLTLYYWEKKFCPNS